eukprot:3779497-Rhodomonas_salina.1
MIQAYAFAVYLAPVRDLLQVVIPCFFADNVTRAARDQAHRKDIVSRLWLRSKGGRETEGEGRSGGKI